MSTYSPTDPATWPERRKGVYNDEWVVHLQTMLEAAGHSPGGVDGDFGDNTEVAVRSFQESVGLAATGVVDADTWLELSGVSASDPGVGDAVFVQSMGLAVRDGVLSWATDNLGSVAGEVVDEIELWLSWERVIDTIRLTNHIEPGERCHSFVHAEQLRQRGIEDGRYVARLCADGGEYSDECVFTLDGDELW